MNSVVTVTALPASFHGGIEEYAYSLIAELRSSGFEISLVTSKGKNSDAWNGFQENYEFETIYIDSRMLFQRPIPTIRSVGAFTKLIFLVRDCDVVHIHMPYPIIEAYISILSKLMRKKLVITYHMDATIDSNDVGKIRLTRYVINRVVEKAYHIFSSKVALDLSDIICTNTMAYVRSSPVAVKYVDKIHVIHQGVREDLRLTISDNKAREIRERFLEGYYKHLVSFVGRLVRYKGLDYLLDAIRIINEKSGIRIRFIIGGIGPEKQRLIQKCSTYGLYNASFIGFVENRELFNLLRASDVVVSPSTSSLESTPISLLCSLMSGTPVVGTSIGGTEETIPSGPNARIIPPKDAQALAEAIIDLVYTSNGKQPKDKRSLIPERYWRHVAQDYESIFSLLQCHKVNLIK